MRISDDTRYPHPVLAVGSSDFAEGEFRVGFQCEESPASDRVILRYRIVLDHADVVSLLENGAARAGAYVRCQDTYYSSLERMTWPKGQIEFPQGELLNRVYVRPLIWLTRSLTDWHPKGVNSEFDLPFALGEADIVAIGEEVRLNIGRAKLASVESIFAMKVDDTRAPGSIDVDPDRDKVTILAHSDAFARINDIRANGLGKATALAAVYLPAVMQLLDRMRDSNFEGRRWTAPFVAKCDAVGVDLKNIDLLIDAQKLLNFPLMGLKPVEESV